MNWLTYTNARTHTSISHCTNHIETRERTRDNFQNLEINTYFSCESILVYSLVLPCSMYDVSYSCLFLLLFLFFPVVPKIICRRIYTFVRACVRASVYLFSECIRLTKTNWLMLSIAKNKTQKWKENRLVIGIASICCCLLLLHCIVFVSFSAWVRLPSKTGATNWWILMVVHPPTFPIVQLTMTEIDVCVQLKLGVFMDVWARFH